MKRTQKTVLQAFFALFVLVSAGCGNGGGSSISRREFDALQKRVTLLETSMQNELLVPGVYYQVVRVVDGDTFVISGDRKVRMHGVNTPESVHSQKGLQWYGKESSDCLKNLLTGKSVRLEPEDGKNFKTGAYGRILAFVYRKDGMFVNAEVIRRGAALSYRKYKCSLRDKFDEIEARAKARGIGVWDDEERVKWEATHILPVVPVENATVIASKASKMLHSLACGRKPAPENGIYFESPEHAAIFRITKHHACVKEMEKAENQDDPGEDETPDKREG